MRFIAPTLLLAGTLSAMAQLGTEPHSRADHTWTAGDVGCDRIYVNGEELKVLSLPTGLEVRAALTDRGRVIEARIVIANKSSDRIDVLPEKFSLWVSDGRDRTSLPYRTPEQVIADIRGGVAGYASVLNSVAALGDPASPETAEAKRQADAKIHRVASAAENRARELQANALRSNTVFPGQTVSGTVAFERPRNRRADQFEMSLQVGSETFTFPFTIKRHSS